MKNVYNIRMLYKTTLKYVLIFNLDCKLEIQNIINFLQSYISFLCITEEHVVEKPNNYITFGGDNFCTSQNGLFFYSFIQRNSHSQKKKYL